MKQIKSTWSVMAAAALAASSMAAVPASALAAAQDVASLYGPQPPADATYLRVVNLSTAQARVALPGSVPAGPLAPGAATHMSVVKAGTPLRVAVDGKDLAFVPGGDGAANATVAGAGTAGMAITVALTREADGEWHATRVLAPYAQADGMRATLRVANFVAGCDAKVVVDGSGAAVFSNVASAHEATRTINPVAAKLAAVCGKDTSATFTLPALAAGDSYSLFVSGTVAKPVLTGAPDTLAWPARTN
ncbi:hypothetical protein [Trinickia fusca]|uniref:Alginate biosynthesis protein AlgF n=1 Tax=Trinickia fusca TaxID=2419777 RepID=A0A494X7G0_9BURK|nr:hypothetical protein [Trinickia fusca]RKP44124.1 hypothetical protein D7S89_23210 [Trinickia fusca]